MPLFGSPTLRLIRLWPVDKEPVARDEELASHDSMVLTKQSHYVFYYLRNSDLAL